jgi:hypothetical protein
MCRGAAGSHWPAKKDTDRLFGTNGGLLNGRYLISRKDNARFDPDTFKMIEQP